MKKREFVLLSAVCALLLVTAGPLLADEPTEEGCAAKCCGIDTKLDVAYVSKYIWRGNVLNPDAATQPSLTFSHGSGLGYNLWASMDMTNVAANSGNITEIDHTLSYTWGKGGCMSAGYIYYQFPNTTFVSTSELFASRSLSIGKFSPLLSVNYDIKEAKGAYFSLGTGYACSVAWSKNAPATMDLSAKLGFATSSYNEFYFYGADKTGLVDLVLGASAPLQIKKIGVRPSVSYSMVVDGTLRDALSANGVNSDNFVGAVTLSYAF